MSEKKIERHVFNINKKVNGGEAVMITTDFYDNGDKENNIFINQEITLCSYGNSASISLFGSPLTPEILRDLANQLDSVYCKYKK